VATFERSKSDQWQTGKARRLRSKSPLAWIPNRGTPAFVLSNIHEVGVVCLGTTAQMIDFRIADLRALAFHRIAFLKYSFLEASNSLMISRARAWACTARGP
jgi:hypothetical protein